MVFASLCPLVHQFSLLHFLNLIAYAWFVIAAFPDLKIDVDVSAIWFGFPWDLFCLAVVASANR